MTHRSLARPLALAVLATLVLGAPSGADEGMWLLSQVARLDLAPKGLEIAPAEIYRAGGSCLARAVVNLGGGTGSFVSARGLLLTNHHVALRAVQEISTDETNYVRDGFLAKNLADEREAERYTATVTLRCEDVTARVLEGLKDDATLAERVRHVEKRHAAILEEYKKKTADKHVRTSIKEIFNGAGHVLYQTKTYRDLRLVYAPPVGIGEFGGDEDNWMWPRHCGDFAFFRVYAAPDGTPASYATDNVPLKTERWLKLSTAGVRPGDFTFILGYPALTYRTRSSFSVRYHRDRQLPDRIKALRKRLSDLEKLSEGSAERQLRNLTEKKMLLNGLKNYLGKVEWLKRKNLVEKMQAEERELRAFIAADPARQAKYGKIFDELARIYLGIEHRGKLNIALDRFDRSRLARLGMFLRELGVETAKPDKERRRRFRERRLARTKARMLRDVGRLDAEAERETFTAAVKAFARFPDPVVPAMFRAVVREKTGAARVEALASHAAEILDATRVGDAETFKRYLELAPEALRKLQDPLVRLAAGLEEAKAAVITPREIATELTAQRRLLHEVRQAWKPALRYPDADRSLRFTYGTVRGYRVRDAVNYGYMTSLAGVVEKETGREPFASPLGLLRLYSVRNFGPYVDPALGSVPVDFVHDTDITGGNSGSPVLNARGEMVGIAFDGNWESITSDYRYEKELTRTISVDIRYVLFVTDKFARARRLLEELGVNPSE